MYEATVANLEEKFGGPIPYVGERHLFPEISDDQYRMLDQWTNIMYADFRAVEMEDGTWLQRAEVRYLYLAEMVDEIQSLPEYIRVGLLNFALTQPGPSMSEEYDPAHDLTFLQEYFMLEKEVIEEVAGYLLNQHLAFDGGTAHWGIIVWVKKTFPELIPESEFRKIIRQKEESNDNHSLNTLISGFMYHGDDSTVDAYRQALSLSQEYIQFHAWETFLQNKLSRIDPDLVSQVPLDQIIKDKYLRYFPERKDLVREIRKTMAEFEDLLASDTVVRDPTSYEDALAVMRRIVSKSLEPAE